MPSPGGSPMLTHYLDAGNTAVFLSVLSSGTLILIYSYIPSSLFLRLFESVAFFGSAVSVLLLDRKDKTILNY